MKSRTATDVRLALCSPGELWGGVEQLVESLGRFLTDVGVPVSGVVFHDGLLRQRLQEAGVPVTLIAGKGRYDPAVIFELRQVLRRERINVLHTHGYRAAVVGGIASRLSGTRHVRTEHGRVEPWTGAARLKMRANALLQQAATRGLTDALVYVSRDIQHNSGGAPAAVVQEVIYNGIEPLDTLPTILPIDRLPSGPGLKIGIIGRIVPVKGHRYLLEAIKSLSTECRGHLYVIGTGPLESECRAYCAEHGLLETVTFLGFKANIHDYLRQIDLLVMPSLHEGLPYTLLEAMYHKIPIIASAVGGLAEVLEDGVSAILVTPRDTAALARALVRLAGDSALRAQLADHAHQTMRDQFMVSQMALRYLNVYERVLRTGNNPEI